MSVLFAISLSIHSYPLRATFHRELICIPIKQQARLTWKCAAGVNGTQKSRVTARPSAPLPG